MHCFTWVICFTAKKRSCSKPCVVGCSFQTACVVYVGLGRLGATVVSVIGIVYISQVQTMSTRFADIYSLVHLYLVNSLSLSPRRLWIVAKHGLTLHSGALIINYPGYELVNYTHGVFLHPARGHIRHNPLFLSLERICSWYHNQLVAHQRELYSVLHKLNWLRLVECQRGLALRGVQRSTSEPWDTLRLRVGEERRKETR